MPVVSATASATGTCIAVLSPIFTVLASGDCVALAAGVTSRPIPNIPPPDVPSLICAWWIRN